MTGKRRPLAGLALIALVGVIGGCGSTTTSSGAGSASASGGGSSATANSGGGSGSGGNSKATKQEKAEKFAECMRANGVPHFPDPNSAGQFNFGVDVSAAVFTKAVTACKALQPPGTLSAKRSATQQSAALRFAQCVRSNGVPDFPDPVNGQPLIDTTRIPSSNRPGGMTILNAATHKCGSVLGSTAGGQG